MKKPNKSYTEGYNTGYKDAIAKKENQLKNIMAKASWKTSFMVFLYAWILLSSLILQTVLLLGIQYGWCWAQYVNANFRFPINNMTLLWTIISASYIGVDRAAYCVRSAEMAVGQSDVGNPRTLRLVIGLSILFFVVAVAGNILVDADYDLTTLSTAIGTSISLYIAGQKAITLCKNVGTKTPTKEEKPKEADPQIIDIDKLK